MNRNTSTLWLARVPVLIVFFLNIQCAIVFVILPELYANSFEIGGQIGKWVIQTMGILFLMWNVPYFIALINPVKNLTSLKEAVIMQFIGGFGETLLYLSINRSHDVIRKSIERFMLFDWSGLILLVIALFLAIRFRKKNIHS